MGAVTRGAGRAGGGGMGLGRAGLGSAGLAGAGLGELAGLPEGDDGFEPGEDAQEAGFDEGEQHGARPRCGVGTGAQIGGDAGQVADQVAGLGLIH